MNPARFDNSLCFLFALLGGVFLCMQTLVLVGASFQTLATTTMLFVCASAAAALFARTRARPPPATVSTSPTASGGITLLAAVALVLAVCLASNTGWGFWLAFMAVSLLALRSSPATPVLSPSRARTRPARANETLLLAAIGGLAVLLTAGTLRPDADDAHFVSFANAALDHRHAPLAGMDSLYRSGLPAVEQQLHLVQSYELLVALLADLTGLAVRDIYYLLLPPLWALFAVLVAWVLLRRFLPAAESLFATLTLVLLLALWGDGHQTFGNFGFVRLFQGKAIALLVGMPVLLLAVLSFRERADARAWLTLALCQCLLVGFTSNALVMAPPAVVLALLAHPRALRDWRLTLAGLSTTLPVLAVGAGMAYALRGHYRVLDVDQPLYGAQTVLGEQRTLLVLVALTALLVLARRRGDDNARWLANYLTLCVALLFLPPVWQLAAHFIANVMSWRLFWAAPLPLLLALSVGFMANVRGGVYAHRAALGLWLLLFALAGPAAVTRANWAWSNMGSYKVDEKPRQVAESLLASRPPATLALVPEAVAVQLAGLPRAPALVAVRDVYLQKLQGTMPADEIAERRALLDFVSGRAGACATAGFLLAIDRRRVDALAWADTLPRATELATALGERRFALSVVGDHVLALRVQRDDVARNTVPVPPTTGVCSTEKQ